MLVTPSLLNWFKFCDSEQVYYFCLNSMSQRRFSDSLEQLELATLQLADDTFPRNSDAPGLDRITLGSETVSL